MNIKDFVIPSSNEAQFSHAVISQRVGDPSALYYTAKHIPTGKTYQFPVPLEDLAGSVTLNRREKAVTLMRYLRKALAYQFEGEIGEEDPHPERGLLETDIDKADFFGEAVCTFDYYRARTFYYKTAEGYSFPVPEMAGHDYTLIELEDYLSSYIEKARLEKAGRV